MTKHPIVSSLLFITLCTCSKRDPLDAPIAPPHPTARSEIKRGLDAAIKCNSDVATNRGKIYYCVANARSDNRQQMREGFSAFDTGIYFAGWAILDQDGNPGGKIAETSEQALASSNALTMWKLYVDARKAINLSDLQVMDAVGAIGDKDVREQIARAARNYGD